MFTARGNFSKRNQKLTRQRVDQNLHLDGAFFLQSIPQLDQVVDIALTEHENLLRVLGSKYE